MQAGKGSVETRKAGLTTKSDFTEEEWIRVRRAPFLAGIAIYVADPGGPMKLAKECGLWRPDAELISGGGGGCGIPNPHLDGGLS